MEQPLEDRIAEAYRKKDGAYSYKNKEELWQRISQQTTKKGVAAFWRVAAIFLALIAFGGAFAAISVYKTGEKNVAEWEIKNRQLESIVDSLKNVIPEKITEVQIVEKEKIVYRDLIKTSETNANYSAAFKAMENKVIQLTKNLNETNLELKEKQDRLEMALLQIETLNARNEKQQAEQIKDFRLKPERVKDQMKELKTEPSPKMKLQLLKVPNQNINYDLNSSLLKK